MWIFLAGRPLSKATSVAIASAADGSHEVNSVCYLLHAHFGFLATGL